MKLRTFKNKKDKLYHFEIKSKKLGKKFLVNPQGFDSKIHRNDFLISVLHSLSDKKLIVPKEAKNNKAFVILKNKFGKTILASKRFKKEDLKPLLRELNSSLPDLIKHASLKPNSNFLKLNTDKKTLVNQKKEILKKDKKPKSEKTYLKKGNYHFNDIYYDIFLSGNGKHYFSFVNKKGKTVLLNANIKGFESVNEAELMISQVLKFAPNRKNFEVKTAKDGKFFFNLYNEKNEKIAKSFFFRKKEDLEASLKEFIGSPNATSNNAIIEKNKAQEKTKLSNQITKKESSTPIVPPIVPSIHETALEKERIRKRAEAEERRKAAERERLALEKRRESDRLLRERKEKEIALAAKKDDSRKIQQIEKQEKEKLEKERLAAIHQTKNNGNSNDGDLFDGCFKWLGFLLLLLFIALILSYFKGCFDQDTSTASHSEDSSLSDSTLGEDDDTTNNSLQSDSDRLNQDDDNTASNKISESNSDGNNSDNNIASDNNASDNNSDNNASSNENEQNSQSANNSNSNLNTASCDCSKNALVFEIPNTEAKSVDRLGTNPQFGNTHGLSPVDFYEELKHAAETNSWDKSYLNYLYKAMGYSNGFVDARASQFSESTIIPGIKGILGFGKYSGYGYSKLDLKGKDLEVFRIEAANGCHISFMKTCGNLLFICE